MRTESLQLQKAYFAIGAIKFAQRSKPSDSGMEGSDAPVVSGRFRPKAAIPIIAKPKAITEIRSALILLDFGFLKMDAKSVAA